MNQKHFAMYGTELTGAAAALVNFERDRKREISDMIDNHDKLSRKIEHLDGKLAQERADMDARLSNFHRELAERETKTRADLRAELGRRSLTERGLALQGDDAIEEAILEALKKPARGILGLRGRAIEMLKLERELTELRLKAANIAERPFRLRQQAALDFFRELLAVAQIEVKYVQGGSDFGETSAASVKLKELNERLAIASGTWERNFYPVHFQTATADAVLEFALQLPENVFDQVFRAWQSVKLGGGKGASLTFNGRHGKLTWRFRRSKIMDAPRIAQIADFGSGSTTGEQTERARRQARV